MRQLFKILALIILTAQFAAAQAGAQIVRAVPHNSSLTEIGTASNPVRINPTGTTAQPVTDNGGSLTVDGAVSCTLSVPVSIDGTVVCNAGSDLNTSALALESSVDGIEGLLTTIDADTSNLGGMATSLSNIDTDATTIIGHVDGIESALTTLNAKDFATQTTLAAINAKLVTGNDIGDVTINNASGASAVNIQDGGNSITVDGTVTVTDGAGALNVIVDSGSVNIGTFPDNEPFNLAQVSGTALAVNSGVLSNGVPRFTIATDDEINDDIDAIRISAAAIDTDTTTIIGHVDGIEGLIGTTNTNTGNTATSVSSIDGKLPSAAAMADNTSNPTVTKIGSYLMGYDGSTWDRVGVAQPSADNVGSSSFQGLLGITTLYGYDGTNFDRVRAPSGALWMQGDTAHDADDTTLGLNPVKIGGKAFTLEPSSAGTLPGQAAVAANDRTNAQFSLNGQITEHPVSIYQLATDLDQVYDDSPTGATGTTYDSFGYRAAILGFCALSSSAFTGSITLTVEVSADNSVWFELKNGVFSGITYAASVLTSEKCYAFYGDISSRKIRLKYSTTGTTAGNTITVDDTFINMRN